MKDRLIDLILNNQTLFGFLFIALSIILLIVILKYNRPFNDFNNATWKSYVYSWTFIVGLFIFGIFLILNKF
jgi:hypothetical protein